MTIVTPNGKKKKENCDSAAAETVQNLFVEVVSTFWHAKEWCTVGLSGHKGPSSPICCFLSYFTLAELVIELNFQRERFCGNLS